MLLQNGFYPENRVITIFNDLQSSKILVVLLSIASNEFCERSKLSNAKSSRKLKNKGKINYLVLDVSIKKEKNKKVFSIHYSTPANLKLKRPAFEFKL